jgi:hypothetical protein
MSELWFRDYVLLQFRIDKVIRKFTEYRFVDYYYWETIDESLASRI